MFVYLFALYGLLSDRKNRNVGVTRVFSIKRVGWLFGGIRGN